MYIYITHHTHTHTHHTLITHITHITHTGFINLQKGGNMQKEGQCGILSQASYPVL